MDLTNIIESLGDHHLVVMPISRVLLEDGFSIRDFHFFPVGRIDFETLNPVANFEYTQVESGVYQGTELRELTTSLTQFNLDTLCKNSLIAFPYKINYRNFAGNNHQRDVSLLKELSEKGEKVLDAIRFEHCRLDLPDTLPGQIGSWEASSDYLGALIYNPITKDSRLIAGSAVESSVIVKGIGLDMSGCHHIQLIAAEDGELAAILVHGMMMLSDAMMAPNETIKFIRTMTLLEFLGNPDGYMNWGKLKTKISCHIAKDRFHYNSLLERFRELTSITANDGEQMGLRTQIIHNGKSLPQMIARLDDRKSLFRELQSYAMAVMLDIKNIHELSLKDLEELRQKKLNRLGV